MSVCVCMRVCVCVCACVHVCVCRCRVGQDGLNWLLHIQWSFQFGCSGWFRLLVKGDHVTCVRQWCKYKYKCVCVCVCVCGVCVPVGTVTELAYLTGEGSVASSL